MKLPTKNKAMIMLAAKLSILLIAVFALSALMQYLPSVTGFDRSWIDAHTRHNGFRGILTFSALAVGLLCIGMPRQVVAFLGGYAFGFAEGAVYSTLAASVSCALCFAASRWWARKWVTRRYPAKALRISRFLEGHTFLKALLIRLLPVGNNLLTNLVAGVATIRALPFIAGSSVGYIPQMMIFSLMGKGVVVQSGWKMALSVMLMGLSVILGLYLYRRYKAEKNANDTSLCNKKLDAGIQLK